MGDDAALGIVVLILGGFVIGAAIFLIVIVVCVALILGPPALAGYGLWREITVHHLSHRKVWQTIGVGVTLLLVPVLALFCAVPPHTVFAPGNNIFLQALWAGIVLGFAGAASFIALSAFRQAQWPHWKALWEIKKEMRAQRARRWLLEEGTRQADREIARHQEAKNRIAAECEQIDALTNDLVREHDAALYSSALLRLKRECSAKDAAVLESELASLNRVLKELPREDPQYAMLTLQAGLIRREALNKILGPEPEAACKRAEAKRCQLLQDIEAVNAGISALEALRQSAISAIQEGRRMRVAIH